MTETTLKSSDLRGSFGTVYLESIGPAAEQSDWLILVIAPLN